MADLKTMKGVAARDLKMIADAEALLGPEPSTMGFVKNLFWGRIREDRVFPYPEYPARERQECDELLARLDQYLRDEHPAIEIDQNQEIPRWVVERLFELGVLGMTIPKEYGGLGLGITSYNRVLERIGRSCGSTAVLVSAHQSIGCKAVMLFGNEEQQKAWLPKLAREWVSAFCLSEPNVGCDAGGQETEYENTPEGDFLLTGEKKWATSGAISGMFTVMAREKRADGKGRISALVVMPQMEGVDIYQNNRSKCGIRGTWQARIRFHNVRVPKEHLLHTEGKGLNVALTCLNYGRCTLSAGMLGGAVQAMNQGIKWAQTRYQFQRPLADFELVQARIANMAALTYAMDAVLYLTTGMLDRHDEDIMVETAICKVFNSEMGWRVVNDAVQIMGGESYMTENEIERIFRDSRINLIVEGANEVMMSFLFAYGGKQLAEKLVGVKERVGWDRDEPVVANLQRIARNGLKPEVLKAAVPLAFELFLGIKPSVPAAPRMGAAWAGYADRMAVQVRELSHQFKVASKVVAEKIVERQVVQARIAEAAMWLYGWAAVLAKVDRQEREGALIGAAGMRDREAARHFMELAEGSIRACFRALTDNQDATMKAAAETALRFTETLPNEDFVIPERSPNAKGTGRRPKQMGIQQFPGRSRDLTMAGH
jgi:alkylation response protein AidB-like acyl-CoA dehydrogenase